MKLPLRLWKKYSSAMFLPPATAKAPSAMKSLLCIRWLSRAKSPMANAHLVALNARAVGNGLNTLIWTFGVAARFRSSVSLLSV